MEANMNALRIILLVLLAQAVVAQVYCVRVIGHTPGYEWIFLSKGDFMRSAGLRGLDDLGAAATYPETNRIDRIFADSSKERTNQFYVSCVSELPEDVIAMRCPGGLVSLGEIYELTRYTVAVPRNSWTNHIGHSMLGRYVISLTDSTNGQTVIDLRAGSCATVFFSDGTYRCVMPGGCSCLKEARTDASTNNASASPSEN